MIVYTVDEHSLACSSEREIDVVRMHFFWVSTDVNLNSTIFLSTWRESSDNSYKTGLKMEDINIWSYGMTNFATEILLKLCVFLSFDTVNISIRDIF